MKTFQPISAARALRIRELSIKHRQDEFIAAEAEADAALHDVADYACSAKFSRKDAIEKMAALNMILHEAEQRRACARRRLQIELDEYVRVTAPEED